MNKVEKYLLDAGVRPELKGFDYLEASIELVIEDKSRLRKVTQNIYPVVATMFADTTNKVERAMRNALAVAGILKTNSEFIAYSALVLKE